MVGAPYGIKRDRRNQGTRTKEARHANDQGPAAPGLFVSVARAVTILVSLPTGVFKATETAMSRNVWRAFLDKNHERDL
jgi:hypothetical protein